MVSKVQSMASISELMVGQNSKSSRKEEAVHLMANRKQRGSQQEGVGQDTAPEACFQGPDSPFQAPPMRAAISHDFLAHQWINML